jgi:hypothetical protein
MAPARSAVALGTPNPDYNISAETSLTWGRVKLLLMLA